MRRDPETREGERASGTAVFATAAKFSAREQASVMAAALLLFVMRNNEERRERERAKSSLLTGSGGQTPALARGGTNFSD